MIPIVTSKANDGLERMQRALAREGAVALTDAFDAKAISTLGAECDRTLSDPTATATAATLLRRSPMVTALSEEGPIATTARALLGPAAIPFSAFFLDKTLDGNWEMPWHQNLRIPVEEPPPDVPLKVLREHGVPHVIPDRAFLDGVLIARVSLDDQHAENGGLEVVPGSHTDGILTDARVAAVGDAGPGHPCIAPAGTIVFFRALLVHRSLRSTSTDRRRVLQLEFTANELPFGLRWYGLSSNAARA